MKYVMSAILLASIALAPAIHAAETLSNETTHNGVNSMISVSLGENSKLTVLPSERTQIRAFYRDVLDCPQTKESERIDIFKIGSTFFLGVVYDDSALSNPDHLKSIWLDLRTAHPKELKQKVLQFGIKEIEHFDKKHFYFQAPGGQVWRIVGSDEDMAKWQK